MQRFKIEVTVCQDGSIGYTVTGDYTNLDTVAVKPLTEVGNGFVGETYLADAMAHSVDVDTIISGLAVALVKLDNANAALDD